MLSLLCDTDKKLFVYVLCSFKSRNIDVRNRKTIVCSQKKSKYPMEISNPNRL